MRIYYECESGIENLSLEFTDCPHSADFLSHSHANNGFEPRHEFFNNVAF